MILALASAPGISLTFSLCLSPPRAVRCSSQQDKTIDLLEVAVKGKESQPMLHGIGGYPDVVGGDGLAFLLQFPDDQGIVFRRFQVMREHFNAG